MLTSRLNYYKRVYSAYLKSNISQTTFWHGEPEVNPYFKISKLGEYYMPFIGKANYTGQKDKNGIPMLDYHGVIGLQYNPIAIAQYGLGNYNQFCRTEKIECRQRFLDVADWLVNNLERNMSELWVWMHHFDWEYRDRLKAPWYSGLAQGQGISLLVRAYVETQDGRFLCIAERAYQTFLCSIDNGGVIYWDEDGCPWIEEYIVFPPTHILNGYIWASWGVYDYYLATGKRQAKKLFDQVTNTLVRNLSSYDVGFWSLYEHSGTFLKMIASPYYHQLHIVQLKIMYKLTGEEIFRDFAQRWAEYRQNTLKRMLALGYKAIFKFFYY